MIRTDVIQENKKCKEMIYNFFFISIPILLDVDKEHNQGFKKTFLKTRPSVAALQGTDMSTAS